MWHKRVEVNLAVLIPLILGGLAALTVLGADQVSRALWPRASIPERTLMVAVAGGLAVAGAGAVFAVLLLRPLRRLLSTAGRTLPTRPGPTGPARSELDRLGEVVDQVAEVLGALEAKALFPDMVGESRAMRGVFSRILKVAPTEATVLLVGESGTGKELAARAIHARSLRAKEPFVAVNCAAIPAGLLESELFGHEKGAFTGAVARRIGRFEQAQGGTLFLDEIGDMPPEIQAKILRVIETRECERLGGGTPVRLDVRIVAATHRDLEARMAQGLFREDLFHRLNVFPLALPPLRRRREDIPLLAERFLEAGGSGHRELSLEALQRLLAHDWPGNIRELKNVLERAVVLAGDGPIGVEHLAGPVAGPVEGGGEGGDDLDARLVSYEKSLIEAALSRADGVQARAAVLLGIKERSLWHRVKKLGIRPGDFKTGPGRSEG